MINREFGGDAGKQTCGPAPGVVKDEALCLRERK